MSQAAQEYQNEIVGMRNGYIQAQAHGGFMHGIPQPMEVA